MSNEVMPFEDYIKSKVTELDAELAKTRERLIQTEGVMFALCNHLGLAPAQEIIRTGQYDEPFIYRGAVVQK